MRRLSAIAQTKAAVAALMARVFDTEGGLGLRAHALVAELRAVRAAARRLRHPPRMGLPEIALAVRQPWAWAIVHGRKDIENRTLDACVKGGMKPGRRIAILASVGMTRDEYESAAEFINDVSGLWSTPPCPPAHELLRGGIIGTVYVCDIVKDSTSPWFIEQRLGRGLLLADAKPCEFVRAGGKLGYFRWSRMPGGPLEPMRWMLPAADRPRKTRVERTEDAVIADRFK